MENKLLIKQITAILLGTIILFSILLSLTGCSTPTVVEKNIFEDIKSSDTLYSMFDFEYDSMEITKRLTDEKNKRDTAWAKFTCRNKDFEYNAEYIVTYILYNDGWKFENCQISNASYTATSIPDDEIIISSLVPLRDGVSIDKIQKNCTKTNEYTCIVTAKKQNTKYLTTTYEYAIKLGFTPEQGWYVTETNQTNQSENWDKLIGKWTAVSDGIQYEINISSILTSPPYGGVITLDFYSSDNLGYFEKGRTYTLENSSNTRDTYIARIRNSNGILVYSFAINGNGLYDSSTDYTKIS